MIWRLAIFLVLLVCCTGLAPRCKAQELALPAWVESVGSERPPEALWGEDRLQHLPKGVAAPYDGILLDMATASRWTLRLDWAQKQLKLDTELLRDVLRREVEMRETVMRSNEDSRKREIDGLRSDLRSQAATFAKNADPPFYKTAAFGFITGVLTTGAIAGLSAFLIAQ